MLSNTSVYKESYERLAVREVYTSFSHSVRGSWKEM